MPAGLTKATNYYNRLAAWRDWEAIAARHPEIAARFAPRPNAGWRTIDKAIAKLRQTTGDTIPSPSTGEQE